MISHIKKAHEHLAKHATIIHEKVKPHLTWKNIITAKLALFFGFLGHVVLPKLALLKTGAIAAVLGIGGQMASMGFQPHANLEPICGNGTIEGAEICDGIVLANGVNVPQGVIWKCTDTCQLDINVPRFSEEETDEDDILAIQNALRDRVSKKLYVSESDHAVATVEVATKKAQKVSTKKSVTPKTLATEVKSETPKSSEVPKQAVKVVQQKTDNDDDDLGVLLRDLTKEDDTPPPVPVNKTPQKDTDDSLESLLSDLTREG